MQMIFRKKLKRLKDAIRKKETRIVSHRISSLARLCSTSQRFGHCEFLELPGLENSSSSSLQSWTGTLGLPSIPTYETALQKSRILLPWRHSKAIQRMLICPEPNLFLLKDLKNWHIAVINLVNICRSKADIRLYLYLVNIFITIRVYKLLQLVFYFNKKIENFNFWMTYDAQLGVWGNWKFPPPYKQGGGNLGCKRQ